MAQAVASQLTPSSHYDDWGRWPYSPALFTDVYLVCLAEVIAGGLTLGAPHRADLCCFCNHADIISLALSIVKTPAAPWRQGASPAEILSPLGAINQHRHGISLDASMAQAASCNSWCLPEYHPQASAEPVLRTRSQASDSAFLSAAQPFLSGIGRTELVALSVMASRGCCVVK